RAHVGTPYASTARGASHCFTWATVCTSSKGSRFRQTAQVAIMKAQQRLASTNIGQADTRDCAIAPTHRTGGRVHMRKTLLLSAAAAALLLNGTSNAASPQTPPTPDTCT